MTFRSSAKGFAEADRELRKVGTSALGVPKARVRILSGATSRRKQVAIDDDPVRLAEALRALASVKRG
jgi:uncharacterized protein YggU (UPF0235/DUF167 family)